MIIAIISVIAMPFIAGYVSHLMSGTTQETVEGFAKAERMLPAEMEAWVEEQGAV